MSESAAKQSLQNLNDLLTSLRVESLDEASGAISEDTEVDADLVQDGDDLVLRMGRFGSHITFPTSVVDFWELVDELEEEVVTAWESESDPGAEVPGWDAPELFPQEPKRTAKYRRLQSCYRERVLQAAPGPYKNYPALGSYLRAEDVAARPALNFLSDAAFAHAEARIDTVKKEGGALDPIRLRQNMLSSMPLCFNLFGTMRTEPAFLELFRTLFDEQATAITDVVCEWAPQRPEEFLADRTAFDAVVFYQTGQDGPRFCGIETKYTEPFSATEYESPTYTKVTRESGWFTDPENTAARLKGRKSNQLWRNVLLAAAVESSKRHGSGGVAVVALADDPGAIAAVEAIRPTLARARRLKFVSLESILDVADGIPSLADWSARFRTRYVGPLPN